MISLFLLWLWQGTYFTCINEDGCSYDKNYFVFCSNVIMYFLQTIDWSRFLPSQINFKAFGKLHDDDMAYMSSNGMDTFWEYFKNKMNKILLNKLLGIFFIP